MMRRAVAFGIVVLSWCIAGRSAGAQHGVLAGQVLDAEANAPLPFAGVSIVGQNIERLVNDAGRFRFTDLAPGTMRLRVRRVGYAPLDTPLVIRPNDTTTVVIHLTHIAVRLAAVQVHDEPCTLPGAPAVADATLAAVFQQLTLNAEQFQLIGRQYPYSAIFDRYYSRLVTGRLHNASDSLHPPGDTTEIVTRSDTTVVRSDRPWKYKAGEVVVAAGVSVLGVQYGVAIPTLAVFADPEFIKQHCFQDAGEVVVDDQPLRRIDFRASAKIGDADLDGSIFLDTASFVIRRSEIMLSKRSEHARAYASIGVDTWFDELLPGVPVIVRTNGRSVRTDEASREGMSADERRVVDVEAQHARQIRFVKAAPSGMADVVHLGRLLGVFDGETGQPLAGVAVRDSATGKAVMTSATGTVGLTFIPRTSAVLVIDHHGYQHESLAVSLTMRDTVPLTVVLLPAKP